MPMKHSQSLIELIENDPARLKLVKAVSTLSLPDCWIAAGFVRNAVWDSIHGFTNQSHLSDVDVIWFDSESNSLELDRELEEKLSEIDSTVDWSVKNQSRMHLANSDVPYESATDAMRFWPETATAVGIRWTQEQGIEIAAPYGLDDLYQAIIRPTPRFLLDKIEVVEKRIKMKGWLQRWPQIRVEL
jgi:uncharacterized protein